VERKDGAAILIEVIAKTKDEFALQALAQGLAVVATRLVPKDAARTAATLRQAVAKTNNPMARQQLAQLLSAVGARLQPKDAAQSAAIYIHAMALTPETYFTRRLLARELAGLLTGVGPSEFSGRAAAVVAAAGSLAARGFPSTAAGLLGPFLKPLPCRLSTPQLVELLKHPTCVGLARRVILDHLENRYHQKFTDHWDFVAWAKKHLPGLDLTSPPKRLYE
jgi:hypothetical protein